MAAQIVTALVLVALIAAVLLGMTYGSRLRDARAAVETRATLTALLSGIQDAETGQRGFLLTNDQRYLVPYEQATQALPDLVDAVLTHTAGGSGQQRRVAKLRAEIGAKLGELGSTVALARGGNLTAAIALVRTGQGQQRMDRIRSLIGQLQEAAQRDADMRQQSRHPSMPETSRPLAVLRITFPRAGRSVAVAQSEWWPRAR